MIFVILWNLRRLKYSCRFVICDFTQPVVRFPGFSMVFTGFSIGSMTFGYDRSSFYNCIEKKGKFKILGAYRIWYCCVVGIRDRSKCL